MKRFEGLALAALLATVSVSAQSVTAPGLHPISGRRFAAVMGWQGAEWLERSEREFEEAPDKALDALGPLTGLTVADVGAGSGYFTVRLGTRVGPNGRVYANDLQPEMLKMLAARLARENVRNVTLVQGAPDDVKLPPAAIDLVLMVDVYHEFDHPYEMMLAIRKALKPGGRVALVEYRKEDPRVPIKEVHKMSEAQAKKEMAVAGLSWVKTVSTLPRQHVVLCEKK